MTEKLHEEHEEVMHYTSASGLYGIVTSKTLWASHTSFLNDTEEVVGFYDRVLPMILKPVFEKYVAESDYLAGHVRAAHEVGVDLFDHWLKKILDGLNGTREVLDHYVTSFCAIKDEWTSQNGLLSQWRGYGLDGGYAVAFDSAGLESLLTEEAKIYYEESSMWANAKYHMSEMSKIADEQVLDLIRKLQESFCSYLRAENPEKFDFDSATLLSTICKHRGFDEEKEVRIVVSEPSVKIGPDPLKVSKKPYRKAHSYLRNGVAVPCIYLFEDQKLKTLPIRRIIVGPHPEKLKRKKAVELLLCNHGIDAKVVVSDTPFRGK